MDVKMKANIPGLNRLRSIPEALKLDDGDKGGPLLIEMDRVHIGQARDAFTTQGASSTGVGWAPLSTRYRIWKQKVRPGRKILVFSGDMKARFLTPSNPNHIRRFLRPFTYQFGVASDKAWRHENGVGEGHQRLPRRSVLNKTAADITEFQEALTAFYIKRIKQVLRHQ